MLRGLLEGCRSLFRRLTRRHVTEEEIHHIIDEGEQEGVIDEDEHAMIGAVLDLAETKVREILVPRTEVVAVDRDTPMEEVLRIVIEAGHSRVPVYEGDVDHIVGILYAKDLLQSWGRPAAEIPLESLLRKAYYIPETKTISDLLREFRARRVHMAVALDEYGGTAGIVTIEDILEEIVGEIRDEHDTEEPSAMVRVGPDEYIFDARSHIEEVEDELGVALPRGDYDTLGGFVSHLTGHVPVQGETCAYGPLALTVEEADQRRVSRIRVRRSAPGDGR